MKKVYWRPQKTPVFAFVLIAMLSVSGIFSIEYFKVERRTPYYREKVEARGSRCSPWRRCGRKDKAGVRNRRVRRPDGFRPDRRLYRRR